MKTYKINSFHDVHTDSFSRGEGGHVNSYQLGSEVKAETPREAIENYFKDVLYFNFDFEKSGADCGEGNALAYDVLTDVDNVEVSNGDSLYKAFEEGKVDLYNNHVEVQIFELIPVEL